MKIIRVVTFGGGGGQSQLLQGLKAYLDLEITAVCTASDSGGSSGRLKQEYKLPGYIGDVTKCMWGLSENGVIQKALCCRYSRGSLAPHSLKNLVFASLVLQYGERRALALMHKVFGLPERFTVLPACYGLVELEVLVGKRWVKGETYIDTMWRNPLWDPALHRIAGVRLQPQNVGANPEVLSAIAEADWLIACPGDLYTSLLPAFLPRGIGQAVKQSRAQFAMVANLMTKAGETDGYKLGDFVNQIAKYAARQPDVILANSGKISSRLIRKYRTQEDKAALVLSQGFGHGGKLVLADIWKAEKGHVVHDPEKTAWALHVLMRRVYAEGG